MGNTILYFDAPAGLSGDMILASLLDLGLDLRRIESALSGLGIGRYTLKQTTTDRMGIGGQRFEVLHEAGHSHRGLGDITRMIEGSDLPSRVRSRSLEAFRKVAEAESRIHGLPVEAVHFHEVGAVDSIVDIVGIMLALDILGVEKAYCSPLPLGRGSISCAHGVIPLPAPAALEILKGVPVYGVELEGETVTPTGAAVISVVCLEFGPLPEMKVSRIGYGAGKREWPDRPNVLRAVLGTGNTRPEAVVAIETNIDDLTPEWAGYLMERLLNEGALDVGFLPVQMKKCRPGLMVHVLAPMEKRDRLVRVLFNETTTIGVRYYRVQRETLPRKAGVLETELGSVVVKTVEMPDGKVRHYPEYESCAALARQLGIPVIDVYAEVTATAKRNSDA
ncbi:MAG: nickel pincer cofactor biosynthesis protein LarC [Deltaproteobacteria bacterium]|nr:nickel pincer cofactor biosynthesis protein LarC [Deltaproteobacteria bacterium]